MKFIYVVDYVAIDAGMVNESVHLVKPVINATANMGRKVYVMTNSEKNDIITLPNVTAGVAEYGYDTGAIARSTPGISHSEVRISSDSDSGEISLTLPIDHDLSKLFYYEQPSGRLFLYIYEKEAEGVAPISIWSGYVISAEFDLISATFKCSHTITQFDSNMLTATHSRACANVLFDRECSVNQNEVVAGAYYKWREDGVITDFGDDWIESPQLANRSAGFFNGGYVVLDGISNNLVDQGYRPRATYPNPGSTGSTRWAGGYRRSIVNHTVTGSVGRLYFDTILPPVDLFKFAAFRGCDKLETTCTGTFNNIKNYNGYPSIPIKAIFESGAS